MLYIISFICVLINESLKPYIDYKSIPLPELPYKTIHNGLEGFVYEHYFDYDDFLGQCIKMEEEIYHKWKGTDDFQKYSCVYHCIIIFLCLMVKLKLTTLMRETELS